jgi:hypothetical protein
VTASLLKACTLTVDDPQDTGSVENAFAVLVEVHLNFEIQALIGVFKVWRSRQAYELKREPMTTLPIAFKPEEGGTEFFAQYGSVAQDSLLPDQLLAWCITHSPLLAGAKPLP